MRGVRSLLENYIPTVDGLWRSIPAEVEGCQLQLWPGNTTAASHYKTQLFRAREEEPVKIHPPPFRCHGHRLLFVIKSNDQLLASDANCVFSRIVNSRHPSVRIVTSSFPQGLGSRNGIRRLLNYKTFTPKLLSTGEDVFGDSITARLREMDWTKDISRRMGAPLVLPYNESIQCGIKGCTDLRPVHGTIFFLFVLL